MTQIVICFIFENVQNAVFKMRPNFYTFRAFLLQVMIKAYGSKQHKNVYFTLKSIAVR